MSGELVVVTHIVPSPGSGLLATQPGGNAGAVTESKFSLKMTVPFPLHGVGVAEAEAEGEEEGEEVGVAVGVGEAVGVDVGVNVGVAVAVGVGEMVVGG